MTTTSEANVDATIEWIKATLGLQPHPTCGFVAETYRSALTISAEALPGALMGAYPAAREQIAAFTGVITPS